MRIALLAMVGSSWLAFAAPAAAQTAARTGTTTVRDAATAEALFRQGRLALDSGRFREACPKFAESQRLDPAAGTLMNLATCEEKLGKLASAWQHWKEALDLLPTSDDRIPFAQSRVTSLEAKLPRLTVKVEGPLERNSKVLRDETEIGEAGQGVPLPVDPGPHVVMVRTPGHFDGVQTITVNEGESKQVVVQMGSVDPAAAARLAERESSGGSGTRTLGWALGGVGVAGLAAAATTGMMVIAKNKTVSSECNADTRQCTPEGSAAASAGRSLMVINTVSWITAIAGLGAGTYLVISGSRAHPTAVLAPGAGLTAAGLSCAGVF